MVLRIERWKLCEILDCFESDDDDKVFRVLFDYFRAFGDKDG